MQVGAVLIAAWVCLMPLAAVSQESPRTPDVVRMERDLQETRSQLAESQRQIEELRREVQDLRQQMSSRHQSEEVS